MDAKQHFDAGNLNDAVAAATAAVRAKPSDHAARLMLCDLLCFAGELARADKQLDTLAQLDPEATMSVALFRQLIRAETCRQEFFTSGRPPELVGEVSLDMQRRLQASIQFREGDQAGAANTLDAAERERPHVRGKCDGKPFEDLRDLDDLTAGILEVLSPTGKYFWVGFERLVYLKFSKPQFVRDLLWRRAEISVENGPEGVVYLPVLYPGSAQSSDDQIRLGRTADWVGPENGPIRGLGQRMLWIDSEHRDFLGLAELDFTPRAA